MSRDSLPVLQPEMRALELFDTVPAGHFGLLVRNDDFEPHLHRGEIALVDTNDKQRTLGELYVVDLGPGPRGEKRRLRIVELIRGGFGNGDDPRNAGVWLAYSLTRDIDLGNGRRSRLIDGPLGFECWPRFCQGRIVGVMVPE